MLKGTRILAPSSQRKEALQKIHTSHLGMEKGIVIPAIAPDMPIRNKISITKGLVLKGTRILAPSSQRKEALQKIHTSHLGMEKGIVKTRKILNWTNIKSCIKQMIGKCQNCT